MRVEVRDRLGPGEVEIDQPLYGILLIGNNLTVMAGKLFDSTEKADEYRRRQFHTSNSYVVRITGTNQ